MIGGGFLRTRLCERDAGDAAPRFDCFSRLESRMIPTDSLRWHLFLRDYPDWLFVSSARLSFDL